MAPADLQVLGVGPGQRFPSGPPSVASGPRTYTHPGSIPGYDGVPVDEMEGMGIGSHPGSTYGQVQDMPMEGDFMGDGDMPQPPQDNNQVKYFSHRNFSNICETAVTFLFSGCGLV